MSGERTCAVHRTTLLWRSRAPTVLLFSVAQGVDYTSSISLRKLLDWFLHVHLAAAICERCVTLSFLAFTLLSFTFVAVYRVAQSTEEVPELSIAVKELHLRLNHLKTTIFVLFHALLLVARSSVAVLRTIVVVFIAAGRTDSLLRSPL